MRGSRPGTQQRRPPGQRARRHRVEDPLAGQRVDRRRGVPGEQDAPVRVEPRAGGEREVVSADGGRLGLLPGEQGVQGVQVRLPVAAAAPVEDAVPDVGPPVGQRERPRVRRVRAGRELDRHPVGVGAGRGVSAQRQREGRRRQGRRPEQAPNRGVRSVGSDHGARGEPPVDLDAVGPDLQHSHPVPAQLRTPVERGVDQCRVEHDPRDDPVRPSAGALHGAPARRPQPQPRDGRGQLLQTGRAERGEQVEHRGGDPVTAHLVPGERRRVEQQHPAGRPVPQHPQRSRGAGRAGPDDRDVVHLEQCRRTGPGRRADAVDLVHRGRVDVR
jgi:hypothetical protein